MLGRVSSATRRRQKSKVQPAPGHPQNRKHPTEAEEKHLRALAPAVNAYLDFALPTKGIQRHDFIRRLLGYSRRMSVELLSQSLERARKYRITELETVERIARLYLQQGRSEERRVGKEC